MSSGPPPSSTPPVTLATDWIEALRSAAWAMLDARPGLDAAVEGSAMWKGTKVKFEPGLKVRLAAEPSRCPMLCMLPMGPIGQNTRQRGDSSARSAVLHFELYGHGPGTSEVTGLFAEIVDTIEDGADGLGLSKREWTKIMLGPTSDLTDPNMMFVIEADLACRFRVGA